MQGGEVFYSEEKDGHFTTQLGNAELVSYLVCTCVQGRCSIVQYSLFHCTHRHLGYGHIHPITLLYYCFTGSTTKDQQDDIRGSYITK